MSGPLLDNQTVIDLTAPLTGREERVAYELIVAGPSTLDEFCARNNVMPHVWSPVFSSLVRKGAAIRPGNRRPTRAGSTALVYRISEAGRRAAQS